jgi:hypothetical protein
VRKFCNASFLFLAVIKKDFSHEENDSNGLSRVKKKLTRLANRGVRIPTATPTFLF